MQYRVLSFDCFLWDSDRMIIETGSLIVPEFDEMRIKVGKNEVLHEMEDVEGFISLLSNEIYKCFRDWQRNTKI